MRILKRVVFYIDYLRIKRQAKASGMYFPFGKFYPWMSARWTVVLLPGIIFIRTCWLPAASFRVNPSDMWISVQG